MFNISPAHSQTLQTDRYDSRDAGNLHGGINAETIGHIADRLDKIIILNPPCC